MGLPKVLSKTIYVDCFNDDGAKLWSFAFNVKVDEASDLMFHTVMSLSSYHFSDLDVRIGPEIIVSGEEIYTREAISECIKNTVTLSKESGLVRKPRPQNN